MGGSNISTENKQRIATDGMNTSALLGVAFVVLKLCGVIAWPWVWVTAPLWLPFAAMLVTVFAVFLYYLFRKPRN